MTIQPPLSTGPHVIVVGVKGNGLLLAEDLVEMDYVRIVIDSLIHTNNNSR